MNNLDEAKRNLKTVLDRFEIELDTLLKKNEGSLAIDVSKRLESLQQDNETLKKSLKDKEEEMEYLREQNHKLQAQIGKEQESNFNLMNKNNSAIKKVDNLILEFSDYIEARTNNN